MVAMRAEGFAEPKPGAVEFLGIPVHPVQSTAEVHAYLESVIQSRKKAVLYNMNIHAFNIAFKQAWFGDFIRRAQLVFCDGEGVRWGMKMLGLEPPIKMATTRWVWQLAGYCAEKGHRLFLLGARPGIAEEAARCLKAQCPDLIIAGMHHGHFEKEGPENDRAIEAINAARPDILLTCFGMPLQEDWINRNKDRLDTFIFIKGGAVMDYVTGKLGEAPEWMLRWGLEWLFRVCEEPRRLAGRYLHDIPCFFFRVLREKFK